MTPSERRRIAHMYGATEDEVLASDARARREPMTPLFQKDGWPSPHSGLAAYITMLQEPGALTYLRQHLEATLTPELSAELRVMPYEDFLGTRYWWLVRGMLCALRGVKCEACGLTGVTLDAHHLTYAHRGSEVFHVDDLRLLCRGCHDAQHEDLTTEKGPESMTPPLTGEA